MSAHTYRLLELDHKYHLVGLLVDATTNEQVACLFANCFYSGLRRLFLGNGTNDFNQDGHNGSPYCAQNRAAPRYSSLLLLARIFSAKIAATGTLISMLTSISMLPLPAPAPFAI